jgi:hypothetical protein
MLAASFSAIYAVLRTIPTFEMIGVSARFSGGDFLLTSIALVCGFWSSILSVVIGTTLAYALRPPIFYGLDFLPGMLNVAIASLIIAGRSKIALGVYVATLVAFMLSPYSLLFGYGPVPYSWLHILALIALLPPISSRIRALIEVGGLRQIAGVGLLSFIGTMGQHLAGGLLYELTVGFVGGIAPLNFISFWRLIFWVYPIERGIIIVISTVLALGVFRSVRMLHLTQPTK